MRRLLLILFLTFVSWTVFAGKTLEDLREGDVLPVFSVTSNLGKNISSASLKGEVCVIVFFHTQCWHCRHELPIINELFLKYRDDVQFLCISRGESDASVSEYWEKHQFVLPYSAQEDKTVFKLFADRMIPRVYVCDASGKIKCVFIEKFKKRRLVRCLEKEINKKKNKKIS